MKTCFYNKINFFYHPQTQVAPDRAVRYVHYVKGNRNVKKIGGDSLVWWA